MKKYFIGQLTEKILIQYDRYIGNKYSSKQIIGGICGITGLILAPSIYKDFKKQSKLMTSKKLKHYFVEKKYKNYVDEIKFNLKSEGLASKSPNLNVHQKIEIYEAFLDIIFNEAKELFVERDLRLRDVAGDEEDFLPIWEHYEVERIDLFENLFRHFLKDIGFGREAQELFMNDVKVNYDLTHTYSKFSVRVYGDELDPFTCTKENMAKIGFAINASKGYGRKEMFKNIKNGEYKERLLDDYFNFFNYTREGILFHTCSHLLKFKAYSKFTKKLDYANMKLEDKFVKFLENDDELGARRGNTLEKGKRLRQPRRVRREYGVDENMERMQMRNEAIKATRKRRLESREEFESRKQFLQGRAKEKEMDFNKEFLFSELKNDGDGVVEDLDGTVVEDDERQERKDEKTGFNINEAVEVEYGK